MIPCCGGEFFCRNALNFKCFARSPIDVRINFSEFQPKIIAIIKKMDGNPRGMHIVFDFTVAFGRHHSALNTNQHDDAHLDKSVRKFQAFKELEKWKSLEKKASVLIPLCHVDNQVCILFTLRKMGLRRHSGQVSFPGGMRDHGESVEETAVRETEEEIGIPKENICVYGHGSSIARFGVLITPVVGYIGHVDPFKLKISEKEVQYAFALPLSKFCDLNNCKYTQFRDSYALPVFLIGRYRVWGITAYLTHTFLTCLLDDVYKFNMS